MRHHHVASVCRSSYYQLKQLRPVARSLSVEAAKTLVQAFVSSRLDYCNAILHGLPEKLMRRLQSMQNAAARMITSARRRDYITPILRQLHWLPVRQRVDFKIAVLVFQCLTGHAPAYLADDCQLAADTSARRLRSADTAKCVVRCTYNFGNRTSFKARCIEISLLTYLPSKYPASSHDDGYHRCADPEILCPQSASHPHLPFCICVHVCIYQEF